MVSAAEDNRVTLCPETTQGTIVNSIDRMKEYVDRLGSPYAKIIFDPVNQMRMDRIYDNGRFIRCAIATLGDRIGVIPAIHCGKCYFCRIAKTPEKCTDWKTYGTWPRADRQPHFTGGYGEYLRANCLR